MKLFRQAALKKALKRKKAVKTHTILVVDDEARNLMALSDLLDDTYEVLTAGDGQEALELIKAHPAPESIHLIISDQRMPRLTGTEFLFQTIPLIPKTKRIILTGFSDVDAIIDAINKGKVYKFILKPYEPIEMLTTVRRALEVFDLEARNDRLIRELRTLLDASNRFVPHDLVRLLEKEDITQLQLGDHIHMDMAVMFSDVRGFTSLSEKLTPQEGFDYINAYLARVSPIIRESKGFIIKYLGDGIMAAFPGRAEDAIQAGIDQLRAIRLYNEELKATEQAMIRVGLGIHTGPMMLGMVGEQDRMQGDALADSVNLCARIEGLTKHYGVPFLVTDEIIQTLETPSQFHHRLLGRVRVKGKEKFASVYEIFDADEPEQIEAKNAFREEFEGGLMRYQAGEFEEALSIFAGILEKNPKDAPAGVYCKRLEELLAAGRPAWWDGIDDVYQK